jgi:hypothetical protein
MDASRSRRLILSIQAFVKLQHQRYFGLSEAERSATRLLETDIYCMYLQESQHIGGIIH